MRLQVRPSPRLLTVLLCGVAFACPAHATTLEEAIAAAMAHAPEMVMAEAEADAADARVDQARSGRKPTGTVSGTIGFGRLDPKGYFGLSADTVTPRAVQAVIEQPLFTGGKVKAGIDRAHAGADAALASKDGARAQLAADVAQAYGTVIAAARMQDQFARLYGETQEIERQARLRFNVGESPRTDVAQAQARVAEAKSGLARAEGQLVSAKAHYASLTGLEPEMLDPLPASPALPATLDEAMVRAETNNPGLRRAAAGLRAAKAEARGSKADRLPMVSAFAEGAAARDQFFPGYTADSATVGVRARWQFMSGGLTSGRIAESNAKVRAAEAQLMQAQQNVREGVIATYQAVRTSQLVEEAAEEQSRAAEDALRSVRAEVHVGMKPQLDLLDAEREAIGAAAALEQARAERIVAAYRLLAITGSN
jgi:outer membrane protein